jgi:hypothetical protein
VRLAIDLWRWRTGRAILEALGLLPNEMTPIPDP